MSLGGHDEIIQEMIMEEKPIVDDENQKEREDMKERFKAGAVPLASDFEKLIDVVYDLKGLVGSRIHKK